MSQYKYNRIESPELIIAWQVKLSDELSESTSYGGHHLECLPSGPFLNPVD